jgi:hypothetical protein
MVCFQGVTKPSFSDGFVTCFSIEFLFTKINSDKNDSLDFDTQGASASKSLLTIPKIDFLTETRGFKVRKHRFLMVISIGRAQTIQFSDRSTIHGPSRGCLHGGFAHWI